MIFENSFYGQFIATGTYGNNQPSVEYVITGDNRDFFAFLKDENCSFDEKIFPKRFEF